MRLDRWLDYLTGPHLLLGIVWLGMVCVTASLLLMMVTRWGQSQPLKKCVILSLLTHALLATYATTIEVVGAAPSELFVRTTLVESDPRAAEESLDSGGTGRQATKPWENFAASAPPKSEHADLDRPAVPAIPRPLDEEEEISAVLPSELPIAPVPASDRARPDAKSLADLKSDRPTQAAEEEPIEAPAAGRRE